MGTEYIQRMKQMKQGVKKMNSKVEIFCLCDNNIYKKGLYGEHGLCYLIKTDTHSILFDSGQGLALRHNSAVMRHKLEEIDLAVISHGHFDHCGGLQFALKQRKSLPIYAHPDIFSRKYRVEQDEKDSRYVGSPYTRATLEKWGAQLELDSKPREIGPGILLTGSIPRPYPPEIEDESLCIEVEGEMQRDDFVEEQGLIIDTVEGPLLITGCTHAGIKNTMEHALQVSGRDSLFAVSGGLHLLKAAPEVISEAVETIKSFGVEHVAVSHCTGIRAIARFEEAFGNNFHSLTAGESISFP